MKYLVVIVIGFSFQPLTAISSLANNDPYPVYSAIWDPYLLNWTKQYLKGCNDEAYSSERWSLAISPFIQKAKRGRTFDKVKANLGDLQGTYDMLALLYGGIPENCNPYRNCDGTCNSLGKAKICIFSDLFDALGVLPPNPDVVISNTSFCEYILTDSANEIGHLSLPIRYRKVGVRGQLDFRFDWLENNFVLTAQFGISEIRQTLKELIDLGEGRGPVCCGDMLASNPNDCFPCNPTQQSFENNFFRNIPYCEVCNLCTATADVFSTCVDTMPNIINCTTPYTQIALRLMNQERARQIFRELGLDDCNYEATSFEDIRFIAAWNKLYEVNHKNMNDYAWLFVTPGLSFNAIAPTGREKDRGKLLGVPFGNDGFWAVGFDARLYLDFVDSVQIGAGAGMNYFFKRRVDCYRLPTFFLQEGIFPCTANVCVQPGYNFNFNASLNAYHFLDRLSAYTEWVMVKHEEDRLSFLEPDICYKPKYICDKLDEEKKSPQDPIYTPSLIKKAECITKFTTHVVNASLYYDISPNMSLGFMFQFPLAQRNAYKSTTYLGTFRAVF